MPDKSAIVIDPWDAKEIIQFVGDNQLALKVIINTHEHWDHTQGNLELADNYKCEVWAHVNGEGKIPGLTRTLNADEIIPLNESTQLKVLDTPGHTFAHLCFKVLEEGKEVAVFTGDTLFNAGVGHCRSGSEEALYQTIKEHFQIMNDEIVVYPGHDYLENNLNFTLNFEPDNAEAKEWLEKVQVEEYVPGSIQTTIGDEKKFNTFLRLENAAIKNSLEMQRANSKEVFLALRAKRDNW